MEMKSLRSSEGIFACDLPGLGYVRLVMVVFFRVVLLGKCRHGCAQ